MRYFLTGATGFIGGRIARQLVAAGHEVRALVREPERAGALRQLGVALFRGDIVERETLRRPMDGCDGLFHVAAWYKVGAPAHEAERSNVQGTRNVLETMRELGLRKGVYTSTLAVFSDTRGKLVDERYRYDGPHLSAYDRTKWQAHYQVAEPMLRAGLPLVIVQPGLVYGPGDHSLVQDTLERYLRRRLPLVPRGAAYCWAHVDDVAQAHLLAMERGRAGESYIVAGPPHSMAEALALAERVSGVRPPRWQASPRVLRAMAGFMGGIGKLLPLPAAYQRESLRVAAGVTYLGDNAKARRELGYQPRPLAEGWPETVLATIEKLGLAAPRR